MRRVVNYKFVVLMVLSLALLGTGLHFLHAYQVKRNAASLLTDIDNALEKGDDSEAMADLNQYLGLFPHNSDALARYGTLQLKVAKDWHDRLRAFYVLESALRYDQSRDDVRRQLVRLCLSFHRLTQARDDLKVLLKSAPDDAELCKLMARCECLDHRYDKAREWYAKAVPKAPDDVGLAVDYANLLRLHLNEPKKADNVVADMLSLSVNARSIATHVSAAVYYKQAFNLGKAKEQLDVAINELGAHDADTLLLGAEVAAATGDDQRCRDLIHQGRVALPNDLRLARAEARTEMAAGHRYHALACLQTSLQNLPTENDELWQLADMLVDLDDADHAETVIKRLRQQGILYATPYFHALLEMHKDSWTQARAMLEKAKACKLPPNIARDVELHFAQCYARLGSPDLQLAACGRAAALTPSWVPARIAYAAALASTGKTEDAIKEYQSLAPNVPASRIHLARLLLIRTLRLEPKDRNLADVEQAIDDVPKDHQPHSELMLLRAEMLVGKDKVSDARKLVEEERDRDPKAVAPWLFLAGLARRDGAADLDIIDRAEKEAGPKVDWEIARLEHWLKADKAAAEPHVHEVEDRLPSYVEVDRDRLAASLASAWESLGDIAAARRLLRQVTERHPAVLAAQLHLFELALQARDRDDAENCLDAIRNVEGDGGALVPYAQASLLIQSAKPGDRGTSVQARELLAKARTVRPTWSRVPLLEARAWELAGEQAKAVESYRAARELGENRLFVVERMIALCQQLNRFSEAHALLNKLPERALVLPELNRAAAELALAEGEAALDPTRARVRATELALKATENSKDHRDYIWLGQLCIMAGETDKAEKAFGTACELGGAFPETWSALTLLLARNKPDEAVKAIEAAKAKLAKDKLPLVLAPAYEALGKLDLAEEQYKALADVLTDKNLAQLDLAAFYSRTGEKAKAETTLRKILDSKPPDNITRQARRSLALILAFGGNFKRLKEAQTLVDSNEGNTPQDRRVKALLLAMQPLHRKEAIKQFEDLSPDVATAPSDTRFILAQLYEADGDWKESHTVMAGLLKEHARNPVFLSYYIRLLLHHDQASLLADSAIDRLAQVSKHPFEPIELRARFLHATEKDIEAVALIENYSKDKDARLDFAGILLDQIGQTAAAEKIFRKNVASSKEPTSVLLLAEHLARDKQLPEALDICEKAWTNCPADAVARTSVHVLRLAKAGPDEEQKVQAWLKAAQAKSKSVMLLHLDAELRDLYGKHKEAIDLNRQILKRDSKDIVALNNLAFILAVTGGDIPEALELIQTALEETGPRAEFLDTRAVIYLKDQQFDFAARDLQQAISLNPSAARYFHLAQVRLAAEDRKAAREAFKKALALNITPADLHPTEAAALDQVNAEVGK